MERESGWKGSEFQPHRYQLTYGDKSSSEGDLAKDTINFGSHNYHSAIASPKTIFGCGHINSGLFKSTGTGIVGLGGGPLSLVSQLSDEIGPIFSYCLLPYTVNSTSTLKIGSESTMPGNVTVTTPLVSKSPSTLYYISLEGVSVGKEKLHAPQSIDIIIDSGTALTYLEKTLYDSVATTIADFIDGDAELVPPKPFQLCYNLGKIEELPDITFHFRDADIHLQKGNLFVTVGQGICLFMVPTDRISIFGNIAQINLKVEYDLQRKMVSFAPTDCTKE